MSLFQVRSLEECTTREFITNADGQDFAEIRCIYPALEYIYAKWEYPETNLEWMLPKIWWTHCAMINSPYIPVIAVTLYGMGAYFGQKYFKDREPWNLRNALIMWNFGLSIFSFTGAIRTFPALYFAYTNWSLRENFCSTEKIDFFWGRGSVGFWILLFNLSKFPELIDTFFIVVHKKPLIFLHWYHHITVLMYCWSAYTTKTPAGPIFIVMNYTVHAIMYGYYGLMALKIKPAWFKAVYITMAQISQMIVGVAVTSLNFYYYHNDTDGTCDIKPPMLLAGFLMYGSYLYLFMDFFLKRYQVKGKVKNKKV